MLGELPSNVPLPGEIFAEKYRIERVLGKGGMGVVFAATHIHLHQRFALKLLLPSALLEPDTVERFMREGRAAVKIRSEHIARVIDVGGLAEGAPYIVMEHLEGMDFAELLEGERQLPYRQAVDYVLQACEAVAEAHSLKIVHRDLKPSNMFLATQPDGTSLVKVLDFGISKMLEPGLDMTRTSAMIGSPLYMSPEQLKSARTVDARADIWSIGVILYQLIAGTPPFVAESLAELCAIVLSNPSRWVHREVPDAPEGLSRVIATCLRSKVEERYVNLADLADALAAHGSPAARVSADRIVALLGLPETRAKLAAVPAVDLSLAETHADVPSALQTTRANWTASAPGVAEPERRRRWLAPAVVLLAMAGVSGAFALSKSWHPRAPEVAPAPAEEPHVAATTAPPVAPVSEPLTTTAIASAPPPPPPPPVVKARTTTHARPSAPTVAPPPPTSPSPTVTVAVPAPSPAGVATSAKD